MAGLFFHHPSKIIKSIMLIFEGNKNIYFNTIYLSRKAMFSALCVFEVKIHILKNIISLYLESTFEIYLNLGYLNALFILFLE
jgi:hypothetical protein